MKVELKNPVMVNHTHHRDLEIDDDWKEFGTYGELYDKMLYDETIPDDAIYIEHGENGVIDYTGTVGDCRKANKEQRKMLGLL